MKPGNIRLVSYYKILIKNNKKGRVLIYKGRSHLADTTVYGLIYCLC